MQLQGWGERFGESDVADICSAASAAGVNFYDTAEVYGYQNATSDNSSECLIRRTAMTQAPEGRPVVVGSKYFTIPWTNMLLGGGFRFGAQSMADALDQTLKRLGTDSVDLYQVHFPFPTYPQQVRHTAPPSTTMQAKPTLRPTSPPFNPRRLRVPSVAILPAWSILAVAQCHTRQSYHGCCAAYIRVRRARRC